jgi:nucleoside-diphosphate-sugar epimerase
MRVTLVGGSGRVGRMILPYMLEAHEVTIFDIVPPQRDDVRYVQGSALDVDDLARGLAGAEVFVNMLMKSPQGGVLRDQTLTEIRENYETNTLALHLLLYTAQTMGILRGVHSSSMTVHYRFRERFESEEGTPLDSPSVYGLTKGLGEDICQYFARWFDMNIVALRITAPREHESWVQEVEEPPVGSGGYRLYPTDEHDIAQAYLSAIDAVMVGHGRFDAVFIVDDPSEELHNLSKAKRLLGWEPRSWLNAREDAGR